MAIAQESPIYRDLMRFKPTHLTPNAWAVRAGVSRAVWADMRRHGNPSRRTLEKLLSVAGSSLAEFEALRLGDGPGHAVPPPSANIGEFRSRTWTPAGLPPLPLIASSLAGEWGDSGVELTEIRRNELIDRLPRPASMAGDAGAYAMTIVGDSMWPRFRPGRRIAVSPRSPVAIGDDVLLRLKRRPGEETDEQELALVKELVKRTAGFVELRQFNPEIRVQVSANEVEAIHKVIGELI